MRNPWHDYFKRDFIDKFHPQDIAHVKAFNAAISSQEYSNLYTLRSDIEPLPYLGNPLAPVLVLLANPGAGGSGPEKNSKFTGRKLELHKRNLLHQQKNVDDYVERFESSDENLLERPYFKKHTEQLAQLTSIESVATKIFFVNFHGYQSKSWQAIPFIFPTQLYTFYLVSAAIKRQALIITSRNKVGWFTSVPGLMEYENRIEFLNTRNIYMTKGNFKRGQFKKVLERL
jgi:hypothetical protein